MNATQIKENKNLISVPPAEKITLSSILISDLYQIYTIHLRVLVCVPCMRKKYKCNLVVTFYLGWISINRKIVDMAHSFIGSLHQFYGTVRETTNPFTFPPARNMPPILSSFLTIEKTFTTYSFILNSLTHFGKKMGKYIHHTNGIIRTIAITPKERPTKPKSSVEQFPSALDGLWLLNKYPINQNNIF